MKDSPKGRLPGTRERRDKAERAKPAATVYDAPQNFRIYFVIYTLDRVIGAAVSIHAKSEMEAVEKLPDLIIQQMNVEDYARVDVVTIECLGPWTKEDDRIYEAVKAQGGPREPGHG